MGYSTSFLLGYSTMFIGFSWIFQHFYWDPCCNPGPGVCIHLDPAWPCGWTGQRDRPTTWTGAAILGEKTWVVSTGNRQCRAHGLQNARISCGEVNVRSRAYPLNTSDLWRFWRTFLEFCCCCAAAWLEWRMLLQLKQQEWQQDHFETTSIE